MNRTTPQALARLSMANITGRCRQIEILPQIASKSPAPDGDFYVSVDAHQLAGSAVCGYGLLLRDSDAGVYQFGLANSRYAIQRVRLERDEAEARPLIGPAESEAIHPGEANQLAVIAEGAHYQFFINDQPVGEMTDEEWTAGHVTLFTQLCQDRRFSGP